MSKVLLSGYYGFENFGDEAILSVLIKNLKTCDADITVLTHNPTNTAQQHDVKTIFMFDILKILSTIRQTDILISGGGSLLQDTTSIRSLIYYLSILFMGIIFCKKVIIFAQGIGPINNKFMQKVTRYILRRVDLLTVRDKKSQKLLKDWGLTAKLVNDPVWGIEISQSVPKKKIGIQLREWKYMSDEFLIGLVRKIANEYADRKICIYSLQDKQDYEICLRFENYLHMENPKVVTEVYHNMNVEEFIKSLKGLEYFVAMRYHAIMIGIKYGIKTLAINYAPKVEALADFAKIPNIKPDEANNLDNALFQMKNLSRQNILLSASKKHFSFKIFEKAINSDI